MAAYEPLTHILASTSSYLLHTVTCTVQPETPNVQWSIFIPVLHSKRLSMIKLRLPTVALLQCKAAVPERPRISAPSEVTFAACPILGQMTFYQAGLPTSRTDRTTVSTYEQA